MSGVSLAQLWAVCGMSAHDLCQSTDMCIEAVVQTFGFLLPTPARLHFWSKLGRIQDVNVPVGHLT